MRNPATADEIERRMIEYLSTLHKGQLRTFKLTRLNKIANSRKKLMQLLDEIIEARAEDLAAGMFMEFAPERPAKKVLDVARGRLPIGPKKAQMPVWLKKSSTGT